MGKTGCSGGRPGGPKGDLTPSDQSLWLRGEAEDHWPGDSGDGVGKAS